jgi:spore germination protein KB
MREQLSLWQFFLLIFIFEVGSAVVIGIAGDAKNDAWIAVFIATFIGVMIMLFYMYIIQKGDNHNLFQLLEFCLGKWVGRGFIFLYIVYFFYIAARVLRDFGELMVSTIFSRTPLEFVLITMMLLIMYILYLGIEVLGRTSEIFIPYIALFIFFVMLGIQLSGELNLSNLKPILGEGLKPVWKAIFPSLLGFPFGELIAFTLLIPLVNSTKKMKTITTVAVFLSGMLLVLTTIIQIATLGENIRGRSNYPLLSAAREISLLNFIERVDILIVFIVMFGIIVKVSVFFYGGLLGIEHIFHIPYRQFLVPMGLLVGFFSTIISENFAEHILEGLEIVPYYMHLPMQFGIPFLIIPILLYKMRAR